MAELPRVGEEFAGYRLISVLGRSRAGVVFRAENPQLGNVIALKVLDPSLTGDDSFRARFLDEARTAASMNHPNVIPVHDLGATGDLLYIAMRRVTGTDMREMLKQRGRPQPDAALYLLDQAARALDAAHRTGLVHRDVKPGNLLVEQGNDGDDPDHVYLAGFGTATHLGGRSGPASAGAYLAAIDYVAPEQVRGVQVDGAADQYSLGCVLYQCLTGHVPFEKDLDTAILWAHVEEPPVMPSVLRRDLPLATDEVFARVLAKQPRGRYPTCREFMVAARESLGSLADPAATSPLPPAAQIPGFPPPTPAEPTTPPPALPLAAPPPPATPPLAAPLPAAPPLADPLPAVLPLAAQLPSEPPTLPRRRSGPMPPVPAPAEPPLPAPPVPAPPTYPADLPGFAPPPYLAELPAPLPSDHPAEPVSPMPPAPTKPAGPPPSAGPANPSDSTPPPPTNPAVPPNPNRPPHSAGPADTTPPPPANPAEPPGPSRPPHSAGLAGSAPPYPAELAGRPPSARRTELAHEGTGPFLVPARWPLPDSATVPVVDRLPPGMLRPPGAGAQVERRSDHGRRWWLIIALVCILVAGLAAGVTIALTGSGAQAGATGPAAPTTRTAKTSTAATARGGMT